MHLEAGALSLFDSTPVSLAGDPSGTTSGLDDLYADASGTVEEETLGTRPEHRPSAAFYTHAIDPDDITTSAPPLPRNTTLSTEVMEQLNTDETALSPPTGHGALPTLLLNQDEDLSSTSNGDLDDSTIPPLDIS